MAQIMDYPRIPMTLHEHADGSVTAELEGVRTYEFDSLDEAWEFMRWPVHVSSVPTTEELLMEIDPRAMMERRPCRVCSVGADILQGGLVLHCTVTPEGQQEDTHGEGEQRQPQ